MLVVGQRAGGRALTRQGLLGLRHEEGRKKERENIKEGKGGLSRRQRNPKTDIEASLRDQCISVICRTNYLYLY